MSDAPDKVLCPQCQRLVWVQDVYWWKGKGYCGNFWCDEPVVSISDCSHSAEQTLLLLSLRPQLPANV